jgi:hypothetical protein
MPAVNDLDKQIQVLVYGQRTVIYTTQEFPTRNALIKLPPDDQIAVVCERYKLWMLKIVGDLVQRPDTGYAILAILNSYFDMIAQLSGFDGLKPSQRVKEGLKLVFHELKNEPDIVNGLEDRLRNPMAHMGVTKDSIVLIDLYTEPIVWGKFRGSEAIVINPRLWAKRIIQHFDEFSSQLLDAADPDYHKLRTNFLSRIKRSA